MKCDTPEVYFISLNVGTREIMSLVATRIMKGESFNKIAKALRKTISENPRSHGLWSGIKPSEIDWAVYTRRIAGADDEYYFQGVSVFEILESSNESKFKNEISFE